MMSHVGLFGESDLDHLKELSLEELELYVRESTFQATNESPEHTEVHGPCFSSGYSTSSGVGFPGSVSNPLATSGGLPNRKTFSTNSSGTAALGNTTQTQYVMCRCGRNTGYTPLTPATPPEHGTTPVLPPSIQALNPPSDTGSPCAQSSCECARSPTPEAPLIGSQECNYSAGASIEQASSEAASKVHPGVPTLMSSGRDCSDTCGKRRGSVPSVLFPISDVEIAKRERQRWVSLLQESWFHQRRHVQQWDRGWTKRGILYKTHDVASHVKLKKQKTVYLLPVININPTLLCGEIVPEEQEQQISMAPGWNGVGTLPDGDIGGHVGEVPTGGNSYHGKAQPVTPVYMWQSLSSIPGNVQTILENLSLKLEEQYGTLAPRKLNSQFLLNQQAKEISYWARQARKEATGTSRVLCHYFSRGFPKSSHRKVALVNSTNTSAVPELSLSKLSVELGFPLVFVADSPDADDILDTFLEALNRREEKSRSGYGVHYDSYSAGGNTDGGRGIVWGRDGWRTKENKSHARSQNNEVRDTFSRSPREKARYSIGETNPFSSPSVYTGSRTTTKIDVSEDFFFIGATGVDGRLTQHPRMPSDLLTSCLTTPLMTALLWYMVERPDLRELHPILLHVMPGAQSDRKSPMGQLYHYFQCITEVIAWSRFPAALYSRLFLEDLYLRPLFQGYLLAERIMVGGLSGTLSVYPPLPATHTHRYWDGFENALERCCVALIKAVRPPPPFRLTTLEFREWLDYRLAEWKYTHAIARKSFKGDISTGAHRGPVGIQDDDHRRVQFTSLSSMKGNVVKFPDFLKEELQALESLVDCITYQCFDVPLACCAPGLPEKGSPHEHHRHPTEVDSKSPLSVERTASSPRNKSSKLTSREVCGPKKKHAHGELRKTQRHSKCDSATFRDDSSSSDHALDHWNVLIGDENVFWTLKRRSLPLTTRWIPLLSARGKMRYETSSVFLVEQLPILLQSLLLAQYREKALKLLCRLVDLGKDVVVQCAEANVIPWMMRLWGRSDSRCLVPTLLLIACKICYIDPSLLEEQRNEMVQRCLEVLESPIDVFGSGRPLMTSATHSGSLGSTTVFGSFTQSGQGGMWQADVLDGFATAEGQRVLASSLLAMLVLQNDNLRQECFSKGFSIVCKLLYTLANKSDVLVPTKVSGEAHCFSIHQSSSSGGQVSNNPGTAHSSEYPITSAHSVPSTNPIMSAGLSDGGNRGTTALLQPPHYCPLRWHLPRRNAVPGSDAKTGVCDPYKDPDPSHYPETSHSIEKMQVVAVLSLFLSLLHERRQEEPLTPDSLPPSNEFQGDKSSEKEFANFTVALEGLEQLSKSVVPILRGVALHSLSMILSQTFVVDEVKLRAAQIILDALYRTLNTNDELCASLRIEAVIAGRYLVQYIVDKLQVEMDIEYISDYISTWIVQYTVDEKRWSQYPPPLLEEEDMDCTNGVGIPVGRAPGKGKRETSATTDMVGSKALAAATVAVLSSTASRRGFSKTLSSSFQSPRATFFSRSLGGPLSQSVSVSGGATLGAPAGSGVSAWVLLPVMSNVVRLLLHQAHSSVQNIAFAAQNVLFEHLGYLQLWNNYGKEVERSRVLAQPLHRGGGGLRVSLQRGTSPSSHPSDAEDTDDDDSDYGGVTEEIHIGKAPRNNRWGHNTSRHLPRPFSSLNLVRNTSQVLPPISTEVTLRLTDVYPYIPFLLNRFRKLVRSKKKKKHHDRRREKHHSFSSFSRGGSSPPHSRRTRGNEKNMMTVSFPGEDDPTGGTSGPLSHRSCESEIRQRGHKNFQLKDSSGSSYSEEADQKTDKRHRRDSYHQRRACYSSSSTSTRKSSNESNKDCSSRDGEVSSIDGQETEDTIPHFVYGCLYFFDFVLLLDDDGYDPRTAYNRSRESASDQYMAQINKGLGDVHRRYGNTGESPYSSSPAPPATLFKSSLYSAPPIVSRVREEKDKKSRPPPPIFSQNGTSYITPEGGVLVKGVQLMSTETLSSTSTAAMPPHILSPQQEGFTSPDPPPFPNSTTSAGLEAAADEGHPLLEKFFVANSVGISGDACGCAIIDGCAEQSSRGAGQENTLITGTTTTTASVSVLSGGDGDSGGSGREVGGTENVSTAATVAPPVWRPYRQITTSISCAVCCKGIIETSPGEERGGFDIGDDDMKQTKSTSPPSNYNNQSLRYRISPDTTAQSHSSPPRNPYNKPLRCSAGTLDSRADYPFQSSESFGCNSSSNIQCMVFHPSEPHLISCTSSGLIQVWEYDVNDTKDTIPRLSELSNFHVNGDDVFRNSVINGLRRTRRMKSNFSRDPLHQSPSSRPSSSRSSFTSSSSHNDQIVMQNSSLVTQNTPTLSCPSHSSSLFRLSNLVSGLHFIDVTYRPLLCTVRSNGAVSLFSSYSSHSERKLISTFNTASTNENRWINTSSQSSGSKNGFNFPITTGDQPGVCVQQVSTASLCSDYCPYSSLLYVSTNDQGVSAWDLRSQYLHTPGIGSALSSSTRTIRVHPTMPMVVGVASDIVRVYDIRQDSTSCIASFGLSQSGLEIFGVTPSTCTGSSKVGCVNQPLSLQFSQRYDHLIIGGYGGPSAPVVMWDDRRGDIPLHIFPTLSSHIWRPALRVEVQPLCKSLLAVTATSTALHWTTGPPVWTCWGGAGSAGRKYNHVPLAHPPSVVDLSGPTSPSSPFVPSFPQLSHYQTDPPSGIVVSSSTNSCTEEFSHEISSVAFHPFQELLAVGCGAGVGGAPCADSQSAKAGHEYAHRCGGVVMLYGRSVQKK